MTTLATQPVTGDQLNLLDAITAINTPLGSLRFEDFKAACELDADTHGGWIHPSRVSAILHRRFRGVKPNTFSAWWAAGCGKGERAFMDKTDIEEPIDPKYSKGNGNKSVPLRRLRKATS